MEKEKKKNIRKKKLLTIKKLPYFVVILSQNGYHLTRDPNSIAFLHAVFWSKKKKSFFFIYSPIFIYFTCLHDLQSLIMIIDVA